MTRRIRTFWITLLYLAEGLPFGIIHEALPVYFRMHGLPLADIGLLNLLQLPWSLKMLGAPWVDRLGTHRRWFLSGLFLSSIWFAGLAFAEETRNAWHITPLLLFLFTAIALTSATQDIAIDGYFVRLLPPQEAGIANGIRVSAYRVAMIIGGGGTVMVSGWLGWSHIFALCAMLLGCFALIASRSPNFAPATPVPWAIWRTALWRWLTQPGAMGVFIFILLYRLGGAGMSAMTKPFWVDQGISATEIGFVDTTLGVALSIAGALCGGWYVSRRGIFTALWQMGLVQAACILGYAVVAYTDMGRGGLYSASMAEHFVQGMGAAAQLALLTQMCDAEHAATQYAAMSALFALTRTLAGAISGVGAEVMGYGDYFMLTFIMSFPAYFFLPCVRRRLA